MEGKLGRALSPSGASRGSNEALPFVDDSPDKTVAQFEIYKRGSSGHDAGDIDGLSQPPPRDRRHTRTTRSIGGSLAYAVSVAAAEAEGNARGVPLCAGSSTRSYPAFPSRSGTSSEEESTPATSPPACRRYWSSPMGAESSAAEAVQLNLAVHRTVGKRLSKTSHYPLGKGDEGGWAPGITDEEALQVVSESVGAGPGREG